MRMIAGMVLLLAVAPGFAAEPDRSIPLFFFPNARQTESSIRFIVETPEMRAAFLSDSAVFQAHDMQVRVRFAGANPGVVIEGAEPMPGKASFFLGDRTGKWQPSLPTYRKIAYRALYPGIDLTYSGAGHKIKSEFIVSPGADPNQIRLDYSGADLQVRAGPPGSATTQLSIDANGNLTLRAGQTELTEQAPDIYQESDHGPFHIEGHYRILASHIVGFEIGDYDHSKPLVIDPIITYSTYLGGSGMGAVTGLAVDSSGNLYVTGWTEAIDFPIVGAVQAVNKGGVDAFVVKLNPAGTALVYATYIGGRGDDRASGIAVDASGQAYVTGSTASTNFPLVTPIRSVLGGGRDAFALKLNAAGNTLVYSTYLGGSNYDVGTAIAVDAVGNAYITGDTSSTDFPMLHAAQATLGGQTDAFVTKLTSAGAIFFSTFLGGSANEHAGGIAVDGSGNAYVAGGTFSTNFPVVGAIQPFNGGGQDAFVAKLSAGGSSILYSTYLGGNQGAPEQANAIAVDAGGNAYVAGVTSSANFPVTSGALQTVFKGGQDAFVAKINAAGNALLYSTYLGGTSFDWANGIAVDSNGYVSVAGYTSSFDFPTVAGVQSGFSGLYDAFVSTLNASFSALSFSTYYGGTGADAGNAIAVDSSGNIFVGGQTSSYDFHLQGPIQSSNLGGSTGWLLRLGVVSNQPPQAVSVTPSSGSGGSQTFSFVFSDPNGAADLASAQVVFNNALSGNNACWISVDLAHAAVWLRDDGNTAWLGPITPGAATSVQNGQCTVYGAASSTTSSGNMLTINLALSFHVPFSGARNIYAQAQSVGGLSSGWQPIGTWTVSVTNQPPQAVSVTPSSGSGGSQTFSLVYSDSNGAGDLSNTQVVFNSALNGTGACWISIDPVHASLWLRNDGNTAWVGPITPGTATSVQNGQCAVNGATSSTTSSANTLTVNLTLTFQLAFNGAKNIYAQAQAAGGLSSGWQLLGTWMVSVSNQPPQAVSVTPSSGSGGSQTFSFLYSDPNGAGDLSNTQVVLNNALNGTGACWISVDPAHASLWLRDDGNTAWLGPITPGTAATVQNSQCTVNGATSSTTSSANTLTVNLTLIFQLAFNGPKNVYAQAQSAVGPASGWQQLGNWTVR